MNETKNNAAQTHTHTHIRKHVMVVVTTETVRPQPSTQAGMKINAQNLKQMTGCYYYMATLLPKLKNGKKRKPTN